MAAFADEIGVSRTDLMENHASEDGYLLSADFHRAAIDGLLPGERDLVCDIWTEIGRYLQARIGAQGWPRLPLVLRVGSTGLPERENRQVKYRIFRGSDSA